MCRRGVPAREWVTARGRTPAARTVTVNGGSTLNFSRLDFALLVTFASDPERVFSKDELGRCVWRCQVSGRTVDSHVCHLRTRLTAAVARILQTS